ncbi:MAG: AI-2E family transporter [Patescibacteria group bacterium]
MAQPEAKKITIDISSSTLMKILFVIMAVFFVFYIRNIVLIIFVSIILASAFDPWVDWLQKNKVPRSLSIFLIYLILILVLGGAVYLIIPPIVTEVNAISQDFPFYWEKIKTGLNWLEAYSDTYNLDASIQNSLGAFEANIGRAAGSVFNTVTSLFGGLISFLIILVITFYMTVEEQAMKRTLRSLVPLKYQPYLTHLVNRIQEKIGWWLRGQLLLSFIIFLLSLIGLTLLQVKYVWVLALFAGVTELVPYLGPFLGAIPAVFIAFTQSPVLAFWVIVLYIVIQQLENHLIVPKVMQKAVGLNPIVIIVAILIGARLAGILGVLLAVPVATALSVVFNDLFENKKEENI